MPPVQSLASLFCSYCAKKMSLSVKDVETLDVTKHLQTQKQYKNEKLEKRKTKLLFVFPN